MNIKRKGDRSVKNSSPPSQSRFNNCGDNNSAYIEPINAPPFQSKYKKSRNSPLRIGFIDLKKCYQIRMFQKYLNKGRIADQVIAIKEVIKCIQKSMIYEPSFE